MLHHWSLSVVIYNSKYILRSNHHRNQSTKSSLCSTPMLDDVNSSSFFSLSERVSLRHCFSSLVARFIARISVKNSTAVFCKMWTIIYVHCPLFIIRTFGNMQYSAFNIEPDISFDIHQPANTILWRINLSIHRPNDHRLVFYVFYAEHCSVNF